MFLSNVFLAVNALPAFGYRISQGVLPQELHQDFKTNLERVPTVEARKILANLRDVAPARSGRFPTVPTVSKCPKCSIQLRLSTDSACHACSCPLQLPPIQRFVIATSRALRITQEMISPPESPAFGRLLGLLVAFENNAFESGEAPTNSERKDALACMCALKFLPTDDGVVRIIFNSDDVQIGMNETPGELKYAPEKYFVLGQEWIAVHGYLQHGLPLR